MIIVNNCLNNLFLTLSEKLDCRGVGVQVFHFSTSNKLSNITFGSLFIKMLLTVWKILIQTTTRLKVLVLRNVAP